MNYILKYNESVRETLAELPNIIQVFMLGAVFGQIISHSSWLYYVRWVLKPTSEQYIKINSRLFSKAPEFRTKILEIVRS